MAANDTDGTWMIPPPYPFPEAWKMLIQRQQQGDTDAMRWLSPYTRVSQYETPRTSATDTSRSFVPPPAVHIPVQQRQTQVSATPDLHVDSLDEPEEDDEEDDDSEYEFGYVLRDEWRQYMRDNVLSDNDSDPMDKDSSHQQHKVPRKKKQTRSNATTRPKKPTKVLPSRLPTSLDVALDEARALEKGREHARYAMPKDRTSWQSIERMETALHVEFEAFCDHHTPTVWPQGASY